MKPVSVVLISVLVSLSALGRAQLAEPSAPPAVPAQATVSFSPGVRDILKMLDAKVDLSVIRAYIQNSSTAYNPSAGEIIALKQRGVPDEVVTALLQRGAEVRNQLAAQNGSPNSLTAPYTPNAGADAAPPSSATQPYYSDYAATYPYAYYPYYTYPYYGYYPSYYWSSYWYPWAFCSPFYHGYYGHRYWGHGYRGFYGGSSFAFHNGGRSGPWAPVRGGFAFHNAGGFRGGSFAGGGHFSGGGAHMMGGGHSGGFSGGHGGGGGGSGGHGGGHR